MWICTNHFVVQQKLTLWINYTSVKKKSKGSGCGCGWWSGMGPPTPQLLSFRRLPKGSTDELSQSLRTRDSFSEQHDLGNTSQTFLWPSSGALMPHSQHWTDSVHGAPRPILASPRFHQQGNYRLSPCTRTALGVQTCTAFAQTPKYYLMSNLRQWDFGVRGHAYV